MLVIISSNSKKFREITQKISGVKIHFRSLFLRIFKNFGNYKKCLIIPRKEFCYLFLTINFDVTVTYLKTEKNIPTQGIKHRKCCVQIKYCSLRVWYFIWKNSFVECKSWCNCHHCRQNLKRYSFQENKKYEAVGLIKCTNVINILFS